MEYSKRSHISADRNEISIRFTSYEAKRLGKHFDLCDVLPPSSFLLTFSPLYSALRNKTPFKPVFQPKNSYTFNLSLQLMNDTLYGERTK